MQKDSDNRANGVLARTYVLGIIFGVVMFSLGYYVAAMEAAKAVIGGTN